MWADFDKTSYDLAAFAAKVASLRWTSWRPHGITLHNTGSPTLKQWVESGAAQQQRIANLEHYYDDLLHWHSGPHFFISRSHVCGFANPLLPGVHASCFNKDHLGVEMVGDFEPGSDPFSSGDGAMVRDTAVAALALLFSALKLDPHSALNFHRQCAADHHACPGSLVSESDIITRVASKMNPNGQGAPS